MKSKKRREFRARSEFTVESSKLKVGREKKESPHALSADAEN